MPKPEAVAPGTPGSGIALRVLAGWRGACGSTLSRASCLYVMTLVLPALVALALFVGHEIQHNSSLQEANARALAAVLAEVVGERLEEGDRRAAARAMSKALAGATNGIVAVSVEGGDSKASHAVRSEAPINSLAPGWLVRLVEDGFTRVSAPIPMTGREQGELVMVLSGALIADDLWLRLRLAAAFTFAGLVLGLVVLRRTLKTLLEPLDRVQRFERDFNAGVPDASVALRGGVPVELRPAFEMLESSSRRLREQLREREASLELLRRLLLRLVPRSSAGDALELDDLEHLSARVEALLADREGAQMRSRLQAMLSHELRTPLSVITSAVEVLESQGGGTDEARRAQLLARVSRAVRRLNAMVEDAMVIARLGSGEAPPPAEELELAGALDLVLEGLPVELDAPARTKLSLSPDSSRAWTDASLLDHVLTNLVSNALKFSPKGSAVALACDADGSALVIRVCDSGAGIPEDELKRVFEPFYRGRGAELVRGSGLGLTVVRSAIDRLGGSISVSSREGAGTSVTVRLPGALRPVREA